MTMKQLMTQETFSTKELTVFTTWERIPGMELKTYSKSQI